MKLRGKGEKMPAEEGAEECDPAPRFPPPPPPPSSSHPTVYLLLDGRRTYVGATLCLHRRLRQHNGEIGGGARRTSGGSWTVACKVTGFRTFSEALKFEFAWRREGRRRRGTGTGVRGRRSALESLVARERWSSTSPPACDVPLTVEWM